MASAAHPARAGFEPLWNLLSGVLDVEQRQRDRLNTARKSYAQAQAAYEAAKHRNDTRAIHEARKALQAAKTEALAAELAFRSPASRAERARRGEVPR